MLATVRVTVVADLWHSWNSSFVGPQSIGHIPNPTFFWLSVIQVLSSSEESVSCGLVLCILRFFFPDVFFYSVSSLCELNCLVPCPDLSLASLFSISPCQTFSAFLSVPSWQVYQWVLLFVSSSFLLAEFSLVPAFGKGRKLTGLKSSVWLNFFECGEVARWAVWEVAW